MEATEQSAHLSDRRSFLLKGAAVWAAAMGAERLLADPPRAAASGGLTPGDAAILRFLAAAETIETDAWQQYNELGGIQDKEVPGGSGNPDYTAALAVLDSDMAQYIHDNTDDEFTHFTFINPYLNARAVGACGGLHPAHSAPAQRADATTRDSSPPASSPSHIRPVVSRDAGRALHAAMAALARAVRTARVSVSMSYAP
jgi:hypothetical protein